MARPRTFDESRVLDRAVEVFWRNGFEGTSIAELEEATGLGRQSLYNAFGDKGALFVRALEHYHARAEAHRETLPGRGFDAIRAFFRGSIDFLDGAEARRGCFLTRTRIDGCGGEDVAAVCTRNEGAIREMLRGHLLEARADGTLSTEVDLEVAARMLATHAHGLSAASAGGATVGELRQEVDLLLRGLHRVEG